MKKDIILIEKNKKKSLELKEINLIERFLDYIDVGDNSIITYKRALKNFSEYLLENNITNPIRENIIQYKEYLKSNNKPNTVNLYLTSVKSFYKWLEYENITKDITRNIKNIRLEKRHLKRGLSQEEIKSLLDCCKDKREKLIIILSISCALRSNELVNIRISDFYRDGNTIMLKIMGKGKNGLKQDIIKIDNRVYELIKEYCKEYNIEDYLFISSSNHNKNGRLNTITIRRIFNDLCLRANIDVNNLTLHGLRHTSVEQLLRIGKPINEVSEYVRHKSINTTMIYAKELNVKESNLVNELTNLII